MLRLQTPLAERYTAADPGDLAARITAAKDLLGDELFVLGHHYQRDEVIAFADVTGDSFLLARRGAEATEAFEAYDMDRLIALLHEDASISMPPFTVWAST